ncbi:MAG TPA: amidohydrolase family protein [Gemmatimonadaceae bacterium]
MVRRSRVVILATFVLGYPCDAHAQRVPDASTALVGAHVVDVERGVILPRQVVLVRGDRIVRVAPAGAVALPRGTRVVRVDGAYVIPGLWDMHVHHYGNTRLAPDAPRVVGTMSVSYFQALLVAAGVTGVRDMGGDLAAIMESAPDIPRGTRVGPRLVATGQQLGGRPVVPGAPFPIRTVDDVRRSIALLQGSDAGHVKLVDLPPELHRAALRACATAGIPCVSHLRPNMPLAEQSELGVRSLEHLFLFAENVSSYPFERIARWRDEAARPTIWRRILYKLRLRERPRTRLERASASYDSTKADHLFRLLARNGTRVTPTLLLHDLLNRVEPLDTLARNADFMTESLGPGFRSEVRSAEQLALARRTQALQFRLVREMHAAGVPLLAGTDAPLQSAPGFALHGELALLQRAGLRPIDALRTATLEPARYLGATDTLGTVREGRVADLVVLRRNPLEDVRHTRDIEMVMTRGRLLNRRQLDALVAPDLRQAGSSPVRRP